MQKLQSVSGHSSKQSIAHYSSLPTVLQLKGVSDTISNWFENHQPQRTQISTITNAPFIQNSNRMTSRLTAAASFPSVVFQLLQYSRQHHNSLLRIATNEIVLICIDNRLHQMAFFVFANVGKGQLSSYVERFWNKQSFICSSLFRYYIKQIDSMLPCIADDVKMW